MPLVNHGRQEIHIKVVYYGPGLGGKTTNLEHIHGRTRPELRGKLISLATESERTLFFDLLPVELGIFKGYQVRLHLCTVPGQIAHDRTRRLILRHVDGIVFVVDSQRGRLDDNLESIANLAENLRLQGDEPDRLPLVVQFNKRDLPGLYTPEELREQLGVPDSVPQVEAIALRGEGVFETLKSILKACLKIVGDPHTAKEGRSPSILPGKRASMFPLAPGPAAGSPDEAEGDGHDVRLTGGLPLPIPSTPGFEPPTDLTPAPEFAHAIAAGELEPSPAERERAQEDSLELDSSEFDEPTPTRSTPFERAFDGTESGSVAFDETALDEPGHDQPEREPQREREQPEREQPEREQPEREQSEREQPELEPRPWRSSTREEPAEPPEDEARRESSVPPVAEPSSR